VDAGPEPQPRRPPAAGKFTPTVLAGAAEMKRNLTRERTRAAMRVKRERGERVGRYAPFGDALNASGCIAPQADEQRVVTLIHQLHAEGHSLRRIAGEIEARGHAGCDRRPVPAKTVHATLRRAL